MADYSQITDSILLSVKQLLGIAESDSVFDVDVIVGINAALEVAHQIGIVDKSFFITGKSETWTEFTSNENLHNILKQYVYLKTRITFDPPTSGPLLESMKENIKELEWRLSVSSSFQ